MDPLKVYFVHPTASYDSAYERRVIRKLNEDDKWGAAEIVNPNSEYHTEQYQEHGMDHFIQVASECDYCMFMTYHNKQIGAGMYTEIAGFLASDRPVIVISGQDLTMMMITTLKGYRRLSVAETRDINNDYKLIGKWRPWLLDTFTPVYDDFAVKKIMMLSPWYRAQYVDLITQTIFPRFNRTTWNMVRNRQLLNAGVLGMTSTIRIDRDQDKEVVLILEPDRVLLTSLAVLNSNSEFTPSVRISTKSSYGAGGLRQSATDVTGIEKNFFAIPIEMLRTTKGVELMASYIERLTGAKQKDYYTGAV